MDNRGLERIVIAILLLLNVFLLSTVLSDRAENRRSSADTAQRLAELLAEHGITAEENAVRIQEAPPGMKLLRSTQQESEIIRTLIGKATQEDLGGNIMFYRSSVGQAVFRGSGEVAALFSAGEIPMRGSAERTAHKLMRRMAQDFSDRDSGIDETGAPYAEVCFCRDGYPVFNAVLHFDFSDAGLYMITGTRLFDTAAEETGTAAMNSVSALLRFMEITAAEDIPCTRLTACCPGYLQSVVVSGESTLTPTWQIQTDAGTFLINAETGSLETASA